MLWLRAWFQETNSYPGPRCRDGSLLAELRFSKSDCDSSTDSRMNQVLLTNEHGDVFKRQINIDECESDQFDENFNENIPASPVESEYFYEQYIDYPLNETSYSQAVGAVGDESRLPNNQSPFSRNNSIIRNNTLLNYNQYKLQQLHHNHGGGSSPFTFFGMPLPSLSNLWGGGNGRKSNSRADVDANGKSRLRNYRPRPGELVDGFQFSSNAQPPFRDPNKQNNLLLPPPPPPHGVNINHYQNHPNDNKQVQSYGPHYQTTFFDPKLEKGGFVPMLPGRKGFTPIQNPYENNVANETDSNGDDIQETVSTELKPNVNIEFDENYSDEFDNKYSVLVPTVVTESNGKKPELIQTASQYNVSSLKKGENAVPATSSSGIPLIRTSTVKSIIETKPSTTTTPLNPITVTTEIPRKNIQKIYANNEKNIPINPAPVYELTTIDNRTPYIPTFSPNSTDVINLSKNNQPGKLYNSSDANRTISRNALSALVAPGAQQGVFRTPPGRSVITKVFSTTASTPLLTSTTTVLPAPNLPTAEEYLRTTSLEGGKEVTTPTTSINRNQNKYVNDNDGHMKKNDMEWYYNNYNRSTWKEPQSDPGLNRFRSSGAGSSFIGSNKSRLSTFILLFTLTFNLIL